MARILLFFSTAILSGIVFEGVHSWSWSYRNDNGPKFWSKEKSDCSGDVQLQSPIDIPKVSTEKRKYDRSMKNMLFINYDKEIKGEVKNNGNNVIFNISDTQKRYLQNGRLEIGAKYVPQAFHFHFGSKDDSASGHTFEGKKYPMELHLVHYKDEYGSMKKAVDYHDGIVIIVFFFETGANNNNKVYEEVTKFVSEVKFKDDKAEFDGFSLQDITNENIKITKDKGKHLHFFQYSGTLDEPPCYHVEWMIFKDTVKLTSFQLGLFRQLRRVKNRNIDMDKYDDYDKMAPNFRPIQKIGDRKVYESHDYSSSSDRTSAFLSINVAVASLLVLKKLSY